MLSRRASSQRPGSYGENTASPPVEFRPSSARLKPKRVKSTLRLGVGLAIAAALMFLVLRGVSFGDLRHAVEQSNPSLLLAVVVLTIATYWVRAVRWRSLLPQLRDASITDLFGYTFIGFMAGLAIPRAGEILRPVLIQRRYSVPVAAGFASIILERLFDLLTVLFLVALYLFVLPRPALETASPLMATLRVGSLTALVAAVLGLLFLVQLRRKSGWAVLLLERVLGFLPEGLRVKVRALVDSFVQGLALFDTAPALWLRIAVESLALWLGIALLIHVNNLAFGFPLPFHATFLIIAFLTVGVAIPTPGMVGGFHAAYTLAVASVYGLDKDKAAAAGLLLHALQNLPVLVIGLVFAAREGLSFGKIADLSASKKENA